MKLPREIEEMRDKLAVAHADKYVKPETTIVQSCISEGDFRAGFNACVEHLSKGQEFDADACNNGYLLEKERLSHACKVDIADFHLGARWQFEQMKARVGLAESIAESVTSNPAYSPAIHKILHDKIKELECRVHREIHLRKEAEGRLDECEGLISWLNDGLDHMDEKSQEQVEHLKKGISRKKIDAI